MFKVRIELWEDGKSINSVLLRENSYPALLKLIYKWFEDLSDGVQKT